MLKCCPHLLSRCVGKILLLRFTLSWILPIIGINHYLWTNPGHPAALALDALFLLAVIRSLRLTTRILWLSPPIRTIEYELKFCYVCL
ncbi:hypothetical protein F5Y16DRAFT_369422 [Xylariaceae sp. FL0255]|nr:hypothetical protein F5Y16DRAFT_369422 [Xylariaceae sp. FL0255]